MEIEKSKMSHKSNFVLQIILNSNGYLSQNCSVTYWKILSQIFIEYASIKKYSSSLLRNSSHKVNQEVLL